MNNRREKYSVLLLGKKKKKQKTKTKKTENNHLKCLK